jgi:hypothetical protein
MVHVSMINVALRCYPTWWRERYDDEMRATIESLQEEGRSSSTIAVGLLRDAFRSHLQARAMPRTYGLLATRTKSSIAVATIPWMVVIPFVLAVTGPTRLSSPGGSVLVGFPFQLTPFRTKIDPGAGAFGVRWPLHAVIARADWIIGLSSLAIQAAFIVTLMVLGIGLAAFRFGIRREKRVNRRRMYLLTWLPVATAVTFVGLVIAQNLVNSQATYRGSSRGIEYMGGGHPSLAALLGNVEWIVAVGGWLLSTVALAVVAKRVTLPPDTLRFGRTVSMLSSISLGVTFVAVVVWGVAIDARTPAVVRVNTVVATYPEHALWLLLVPVLGVATLLSIAGASSARRSWRTIRVQRLWDV